MTLPTRPWGPPRLIELIRLNFSKGTFSFPRIFRTIGSAHPEYQNLQKIKKKSGTRMPVIFSVPKHLFWFKSCCTDSVVWYWCLCKRVIDPLVDKKKQLPTPYNFSAGGVILHTTGKACGNWISYEIDCLCF